VEASYSAAARLREAGAKAAPQLVMQDDIGVICTYRMQASS
jgi:hypothetical protein